VPKGPLAELAWLSGSWSAEQGERRTEEHWTFPSSDIMVGMNRTTDSGRTTFYEHLRIQATQKGIFYVASPVRQTTTSYRLVESEDNRAVFTNPEHDYPTRIEYCRSGAELIVKISGNGPDSTWRWQRSALLSDARARYQAF
jgi:hypothetical protein